MNITTTYAVDTAKSVMQLHWVDGVSGEIGRKKLSRAKFIEFFGALKPAHIVMEACGGAHHWARSLSTMGHRVELLPARQVRAFVRGNKDDAADARAIWLASRQNDIRRVPVKSAQQQAVLSLHRLRSHWVCVRTATVNMLRGLLYEFGVVLPPGKVLGLKVLVAKRAQIDPLLPPLMQRQLDGHLAALRQLEQEVKHIEAELALVQKTDSAAKQLRQVPGIGLLGATALAATLGDASGWRNAREFSTSLGLTPRHSGTGGKVTMGGINKRGDPYLRTLLVSGARAVANAPNAPEWVRQLMLRRPANVAVVALANKLARTAWALLAHGREYKRDWVSKSPRAAQAAAAAAG
jgi:transposase